MKISERIWHSRPARLMALGTLAAYATASCKIGAVAWARQADDKSKSQPTHSQLSVRRFKIAAGPLDSALDQFHSITGIAIVLNLPKDSIAGFQTAGVNGLLTSQQAIHQLLLGTGLTHTFIAPDIIGIAIRDTESVSVTESGVPNSVALPKLPQPLIDTAQSVEVVPRYVMEQQGISTLRDALRNVPGISLAAGESGAQGDNLTIRGFTARNDIFLDGIRDYGSYYRDTFDYQQVDVLQGPAAIEFGRGSTGGVINQESKAPGMKPFVNVQAQFGTDLTRRLTADINQPLSNPANGSAFRFNAMGQEAQVSERDYAEVRRFGMAPSLTLGMNSSTPLTFSYVHLSESDTPDYGLPWLFNKPAPAPRQKYYGFPDENYLRTSDDIVSATVNHNFTPGVLLHSTARWANYPRNVQITEPQICSNSATPSQMPTDAYNTALPCPYSPDSDPGTILVNRNQIQIKSVESDLWDQTDLSLHFTAARMRHDLVAGIEGGQETSNPIKTNYTIGNINTVPVTSLLEPKEQQPFSGTGYIASIVHAKAQSIGLYLIDTVHLGQLFELSGGVRWDRFGASYSIYQPTPPAGGAVTSTVGSPYSRIDEQPSYRAAFVYKPSSHGSVYFDYGTSFNPSAESLALTQTTQNVAPEENETYEAGVKWNFLNQRSMMEGALFRTQKDNARETSPTDSTVTVVAGNQRVEGAQFSAVGRLPEGTDLIAGYAYLDSSVVYSPFYPWSIGYPLANVPRQTFNAFLTQRLPGRFSAGFGGNYVGSRTASSTVPYVPLTAIDGGKQVIIGTAVKQAPGYWVFNAMLKRPVTDRLDFQANVNNIMNRFYIDLPHPSHLIPGAGVTALMGLNFRF